jgi:secretion/DNA translocation related TadE-like protein
MARSGWDEARPGGMQQAPNKSRFVAERGSGSLLAVALMGAMVALTALIVPLFAVLAVGQSVQNAADAAALAAADTASGAIAGVPCEAAARAASLNGASLVSCAVDGLVASVVAARRVGVFDLSSPARAGPPAVTGPTGW